MDDWRLLFWLDLGIGCLAGLGVGYLRYRSPQTPVRRLGLLGGLLAGLLAGLAGYTAAILAAVFFAFLNPLELEGLILISLMVEAVLLFLFLTFPRLAAGKTHGRRGLFS